MQYRTVFAVPDSRGHMACAVNIEASRECRSPRKPEKEEPRPDVLFSSSAAADDSRGAPEKEWAQRLRQRLGFEFARPSPGNFLSLLFYIPFLFFFFLLVSAEHVLLSFPRFP